MSDAEDTVRLPRSPTGRIVAVCAVLAVIAAGVPMYIGIGRLVVSRRSAQAAAWNVLLITLDTTRADHLGCYGYEYVDTPTIDAISRQGVRYDRCYSPVPLTLPSHCTMMTGLLPPRHRIHVNGAEALAEEALTLAEILKDEGYATGATIGAFVLDKQFGLAQGFDHYNDDLSEGSAAGRFFYVERNAEKVTDAALAWLKESRQVPTFLWVHYFDAHAPYEPPGFNKTHTNRTAYDAEIGFVDSQLKRLIGFLDETDTARKTLVILTADHGEGLWEHGEITHGLFAYDGTMRVPLIVRFPDGRLAGQTIMQPASLADIMPSTLSWLGIEPPEGLDGRLLLVDETAGAQGDSQARALYFENYTPARQFGWSKLLGVIAGQYKFIHAPRPELYNLSEDPYEANNLYDLQDDRSATLGDRLREVMAEFEANPSLPSASIDLTEETVAKLRSLGYMVGGSDRQDTAAWQQPEGADPKDMVEVYHHFQSAMSHINQGQMVEGVELLVKIVTSEDPTNRRAILILADLALEDEVRSRAIEGLKRTAQRRIDPGLDVVVWGRLGMALAKEEKYTEAIEAFRQALEIDPNGLVSHWHLADAMEKLGAAPDEILPHWERVVQLAPDDGRYVVKLAQVYEQLGQLDRAVAAYEEVLKRQPDEPILLNNLALLFATQGRQLDRALDLVTKAIELMPDVADLYDTRGYVLLRLEKHQEAAAVFHKAVELDPKCAVAHYHLGRAYEKIGKRRQAVGALRRALDLAGDSSPPWLDDARRRATALKAKPDVMPKPHNQ